MSSWATAPGDERLGMCLSIADSDRDLKRLDRWGFRGHHHHEFHGERGGPFGGRRGRRGGRWTPSPGAVYPTINQLEDEGLVTVTAEAGRRLVTLTEAGRAQAAVDRQGTDPFAAFTEAGAGTNLRTLLEKVVGATREVGRNGSDAQVTQAAEILSKARRALYLLLAEEDADPAGPTRL